MYLNRAIDCRTLLSLYILLISYFVIGIKSEYAEESLTTDKLFYSEPSGQLVQSSIKSPFFFLCNAPQQGEPSSSNVQNLTIGFTIGGKKTFDDGYEPLAVYEVLIDTSVPIDGFLLTGAHFLTKEFTKSNHLTLPASTNKVNSGGLVCTVLHEHISRKPQTSFSLMWVAPISGTGCVHFLATGSMQNELLFKDLLVKEVCQKEDPKQQMIGKLTQNPLFNMRNDPNALVLYEDFELPSLNSSIWFDEYEGKLEISNDIHERKGHFYGSPSKTGSLKTVPLDFSKAQYLQYTIGRGNCEFGRNIKIYLGSISEDKSLNEKDPGTESPKDGQEDNNVLNSVEEQSVREEIHISLRNFLTEKSTEVCNLWKEVDMQRTEAANKVHIVGIPVEYHHNSVCLKFTAEAASSDQNNNCWTLDNVVVVTSDSHQGNLWEDFDDINPSNWLFFPGGRIEVTRYIKLDESLHDCLFVNHVIPMILTVMTHRIFFALMV